MKKFPTSENMNVGQTAFQTEQSVGGFHIQGWQGWAPRTQFASVVRPLAFVLNLKEKISAQ